MDWYPHEIDSYDRDTLKLTLAEDGAYSRLIRWYYKHESPIPSDPEEQAAIVRVPLEIWEPMRAKIMAYFVTRDVLQHADVMFHEKCDEVITKQTRRRRDQAKRQKKHRERGISAGKSRPSKKSSVTTTSRVTDAPEERRGKELDVAKATSPPAASPPASKDEEFGMLFDEQFWPSYPRRAGGSPKKPARQKFVSACKRGEDPIKIIEGAKRYAADPATKVGTEFVKTAEVWLNKECWKVYQEAAAQPVTQTKVELPKDAPAWRKSLLDQLGGDKYRNWIEATQMRAAESRGHFYVKSNFAATWLATNMLKEIALAVGCRENDVVFHVRPQKENASD